MDSHELRSGSWITLQLDRTRVCSKETQRHGGDTFGEAYKGQILKFRFTMTYSSGSTRSPKMELDEVEICYVQMQWQLELEPMEDLTKPRLCNHLYFTYFHN